MATSKKNASQSQTFKTFTFCEGADLTSEDIRLARAAIDRSIKKWGELSNSDKCSPECRAYNLSQARQLAEIKKLLESLPTAEGTSSKSVQIDGEFAALLG